MKTWFSLVRPAAAVVLASTIALPVVGSAAQSQDFTPESYVSTLSGFEITASGPAFEITGAELEHYETGEGEVINIESGSAVAEVSFFDDEDTPDDSIDAYLDNLETSTTDFRAVDRSADGDVYHALVTFSYENVPFIYYVQVTEDVIGNVDQFESFLSRADVFADEYPSAQEEIAVDGEGYLADVDGDDILDLLSAESAEATPGADNDAAATPQANEPDPHLNGDTVDGDVGSDEDTTISENPRDGAVLDGDDEETNISEVQPTPEAETEESDVELLLTDSSWQGPIFHREITWDDEIFMVDESREDAVYSSTRDQIDSIVVTSADWEVAPFIYLAVHDAGEDTPAVYLEYWSTDEYITEQVMGGTDGDFEVLNSRTRTGGAGIIIQYTIDGVDYVMVRQVITLDDGTMLMVVIDTSVDEIAEVYSAAYDGIQFDGDLLPQIITPSQLERSLN